MLDIKDPEVLERVCLFADLFDEFALGLLALLGGLGEGYDSVSAGGGGGAGGVGGGGRGGRSGERVGSGVQCRGVGRVSAGFEGPPPGEPSAQLQYSRAA